MRHFPIDRDRHRVRLEVEQRHEASSLVKTRLTREPERVRFALFLVHLAQPENPFDMKTLVASLGLLCTPLTLSAQFVTLASDSFQYPVGPLNGNNGSTGWLDQWYSGANADVTTPGFDPLGEKVTTILPDGGCYRTLDAANWGSQAQVMNGMFGVDGTTLWVRFELARVAGGDDLYGGLSLVTRFGPEHLFIGSPWMTNELGIDDHAGGTGVSTIAGTTPDLQTGFVVRIDFMPGMERLQLWLNPSQAYPNATPALDVMIGDFLFDEIRLQSGTGGQASLVPGYEFDAILLEIDGGEFTGDLTAISATTGGTLTMNQQLTNPALAGNPFLILGSLTGTAPGIPLGGGITLPLVIDSYTIFSVENTNQPPIFGNTLGVLDGMAAATSTFTLPPGIAGPAVGLSLHHASLILDPSLAPAYATNPISVRIDP